jgi:hypothetical protein
VASSGSFPFAQTGSTQFHVADPALPSELIAVTNVSGTTWTVTRGAESTTPVAHAAGFTVNQVVSAGALGGLASTWQAADQGLLAWNFDGAAAVNGSATVLATGGTMYTMAIKVPFAISVTNIVMCLVTNGAVLTSGQCFGALYQGAAGFLIGRTADQATAWGAGATKVVTMALNGGPFPVATGIVYVGVWFNGTTGPAFYRADGTTAMLNVGLADSASRWGTANTGLTNAASTPSTLGTITAAGAGVAMWVALS